MKPLSAGCRQWPLKLGSLKISVKKAGTTIENSDVVGDISKGK
jgi:hypothetical protein